MKNLNKISSYIVILLNFLAAGKTMTEVLSLQSRISPQGKVILIFTSLLCILTAMNLIRVLVKKWLAAA